MKRTIEGTTTALKATVLKIKKFAPNGEQLTLLPPDLEIGMSVYSERFGYGKISQFYTHEHLLNLSKLWKTDLTEYFILVKFDKGTSSLIAFTKDGFFDESQKEFDQIFLIN
jgi:hypothetical protein